MPVPTVMYAHEEPLWPSRCMSRNSASAGAFTSVSNLHGADGRTAQSGPSTSVFFQPGLGVVVM